MWVAGAARTAERAAAARTLLACTESEFLSRYDAYWARFGASAKPAPLPFFGAPLPLWRAFREVCARGGSDAVWASKQARARGRTTCQGCEG